MPLRIGSLVKQRCKLIFDRYNKLIWHKLINYSINYEMNDFFSLFRVSRHEIFQILRIFNKILHLMLEKVYCNYFLLVK